MKILCIIILTFYIQYQIIMLRLCSWFAMPAIRRDSPTLCACVYVVGLGRAFYF